jgi:hypothetical protein
MACGGFCGDGSTSLLNQWAGLDCRLMVVMRFVPLVLCITLLLNGCGGGELSLTEYVERLNAIMDRATQPVSI